MSFFFWLRYYNVCHYVTMFLLCGCDVVTGGVDVVSSGKIDHWYENDKRWSDKSICIFKERNQKYVRFLKRLAQKKEEKKGTIVEFCIKKQKKNYNQESTTISISIENRGRGRGWRNWTKSITIHSHLAKLCAIKLADQWDLVTLLQKRERVVFFFFFF